ncbi:Transposon Ty3-G Gag-Pol poly [Labeo rohita]|uniref:Gypsy retrotransposon integrase-like protein 1 n=1 Tax=Labeo rohita TaxID=84645 RepID=A0A498P0X4_LABRO|nr:Transposon Ty3-G Gag-Pol poly [Labeo rohita]
MERKTVRECPDQSGSDEESSVPSNHEWRQKNSEAEFKHRLQKFNKRNKVNWEEIVCHNCQGISHMRRNCPSPRLNLEHVTPALPRLYNPGTVAVKVRKGVIAGILQPADVVQASTAELPPVDSCPTVVPSHLQPLYAESTRDLREAEQHELAELLCAYSDVFSTGPTDLGRTNLVQHDIQTRPGPPVKQQPRRMAFEKQQSADEQIQQNLDAGLASPSNSCWASPIVMVRKKDQTYRLCVDYRALNERTIKDAYPFPRIQDTLDTLSTAKWFSTLDLASGYWQVELTPQARQAAAFCSRKGLFAWNVMPFGLCNAPATFQRLMDRVLAGMQWEICLVYLDDIIVLGKDVKEMLQRLAQVFERLRQANLKLKPAKCCLFRRQVVYLGHIVSEHGIATDPEKVQKIREWPEPMSVNEVRQFVGLASYYRRFVKDFATVAKPLHNLLRKHVRFHWTPESQQAFDTLKELLTTAPILGYPMDSGDLILDTDASNFGIGAVLSQLQQGEERVLAYGSRSLTPTEQNYCTTRRELLAVVEFTTHFRQYLLGRSFTVRTDHSSLQWLIRMREPEGQLARWLEKLGEYDFKVVHRPGRCHENADVLSRRPCRSTCPCNLNPILSSPQLCHQAVQCNFDDELVNIGSAAISLESCQVGVVQPAITASTSSFSGWTTKELCAAQAADPDIAPIKRWMKESEERLSWEDVSPCGPATKAYWSQWQRLYLKDDILVRRYYLNEGPEFYPQIVLPQVFRKSVMHQMHEGPVGGHFGVERTLSRLQTRYYWYKMREDVSLWCRTCTSCAAKARPLKRPQAPMGTVRVGAPMERIAVDLMGPMNETERFNRYILVVQDYFTKWVEAYPLPNDQAVTVAEIIVSEWVCRYGAPLTLHSDQGTNFESEVFQTMCELLDIDKTRTTPFRPQSDGQVERFNATLQKILATTSERCHWEWDLMVPYAVMAYRATKHSSTGFTPNMMLFGQEITEPIDLVAGMPPDDTLTQSIPQYVVQMRERLELAHQVARDALGQSVERAKKQYDKRAARTRYKVGDAVWYLVKGTKRVKNKIRKFLPNYDGAYFILGHLDDLVYRIQRNPRTKVKVVHHDKLKPYHSRQPLENSWVFKDSEVWQPQEVPAPNLEADGAELDMDLSCLFTEETGNSGDPDSMPLMDDTSVPMTEQETENVQWREGSTVQQDLTGTVNGQMRGRPQRARRPPRRFGDWTN